MIPKIIHSVWLSGDEKPQLHKDCIDSWKKYMPEYKIIEWNLQNLPTEVINHPFVHSALNFSKWAFATDYIRVWALYNYGGIYMDLDVEVYKNFTPFLTHAAFSCIEFNPRNFYKHVKKNITKNIRGLNIEAAVMGAEVNHPWIYQMLKYYDTVTFSLEPKIINSLIMPLIVTKVSIDYGFRYIPIYQVLDNNVHIYPPDTFSSCYDLSINKCSEDEIGRNVVRYARHKCAHSWYEEEETLMKRIIFKIKHEILNMIGKSKVDWLKNKLIHSNKISI